MPWRVIGQETVNVESYFCDACGGEFTNHVKNIQTDYEGTMKVNAEFGYGSDRDGERYEYFFCQRCAGDILSYIGLLKKVKDETIDV